MRNLVRLIGLMTLLAAVLAACAGGGNGDTTTTAASGDEPASTTTDATGDTTEPGENGGDEGAAYPHLASAMAGEYEGTTVELLVAWQGPEAEAFRTTIQPFVDATGIDVVVDNVAEYDTVLSTRVDAGNPPDMAPIPQPGLLQRYASEGHLVNLSDWFDVDQLREDYIESFIDLSSYEDNLYGVFFAASIKSIVWYPVQAFEDAGYNVPNTWDELVALSDQIVADGNGNPWCISMEDGEFSGWPATDWIEDILLRTAGPEVYDQWVNHEIPFTDPQVLEAADYMGDIWFTPDYVYGGSTGINAIFIGDAMTPMFDPVGPQCWLHKQAPWIAEFWPEGTEPGVDADFFYFPPIDEALGRPVLGSGDQMVMFNDRPEVRALLEHFATPDAMRGWIEIGGQLSPNRNFPLEWYTEYPGTELAALLQEADVFRFDGSDTMAAEVGSGTFWTGMVNWVSQGGDNTEEIFDQIEAGWPSDG